MSKIFYGKNPPRSFCEEMYFDNRHPYYIRIKSFPNDDIVPPHYSDDTMEFMLCSGINGKITVEDKKIGICASENRVIVIPPGIVHSNHIPRCDGSMYLLHISIRYSSRYIGIENLLSFVNLKLEHLLYVRPDYDRTMEHMRNMIKYDDNIFMCIRELLAIFELLFNSMPEKYPEPAIGHDAAGEKKLRNIIQWTSEHYPERVTLEQAAREAGFSTTYFCYWFKKITGMTYINYLNQVRVMQVCRYLNAQIPMKEAAYSCGFEDMSYFIQLFKKIHGCTPKSYNRNLLNKDNNKLTITE